MVMAGRSVHLTALFPGQAWTSKAVNQYFVHILSLVTDNNPSWMISGREENDRRKYFMINLHESMRPGRDGTRDPWICSQIRICCQTRYRLRYAARSANNVNHNWTTPTVGALLLGGLTRICTIFSSIASFYTHQVATCFIFDIWMNQLWVKVCKFFRVTTCLLPKNTFKMLSSEVICSM